MLRSEHLLEICIMPDSVPLAQAKQLISTVKGKSLTRDDRKQLSIQLAGLILEESRRIQTPTTLLHNSPQEPTETAETT
jgi:hypothetical protein